MRRQKAASSGERVILVGFFCFCGGGESNGEIAPPPRSKCLTGLLTSANPRKIEDRLSEWRVGIPAMKLREIIWRGRLHLIHTLNDSTV
jgi:hypothetical protein